MPAQRRLYSPENFNRDAIPRHQSEDPVTRTGEQDQRYLG